MEISFFDKNTATLPPLEGIFLRPHRTFIRIRGKDRFDFFQGLITQDIFLLKNQPALYTLFLNQKGRFLWDAFFINDEDSFLIETDHRGQELVTYLMRYKLRRDVMIAIELDFCTLITPIHVTHTDDSIPHPMTFLDPRAPHLWGRKIIKENDLSSYNYSTDLTLYHFLRIAHGLAEGDDLKVEKSFPMEVGLDQFHALNFKKGCYLGQEPVARAHYQGVVRKKLCPIFYKQGVEDHPNVLDVRSTATYGDVALALAMIRKDEP